MNIIYISIIKKMTCKYTYVDQITKQTVVVSSNNSDQKMLRNSKRKQF